MTDKEILIQKGKTFEMDVYWLNKDVIVRKPITAISYASGAPRMTVTGHEMASGMEAFVILVDGPDEINAENPDAPRSKDLHTVTVVDPNTVEFNGLPVVKDNGRMWDTYVSGGFLCYYQPYSLIGVEASIDIKDRVGGTVWASSQPANTPLDFISAVPDDVNKRIRLRVEAEDTAALTATRGVAELEVKTALGTVKRLKLTSTAEDTPDTVRVANEVTT